MIHKLKLWTINAIKTMQKSVKGIEKAFGWGRQKGISFVGGNREKDKRR